MFFILFINKNRDINLRHLYPELFMRNFLLELSDFGKELFLKTRTLS